MLTPSQRKKVAETVLGRKCTLIGEHVATGVLESTNYWWQPDVNLGQKDALVSKIAGLIRPLSYLSDPDSHERHHRHSLAFIEALATNDTNALESLAYELLEAE